MNSLRCSRRPTTLIFNYTDSMTTERDRQRGVWLDAAEVVQAAVTLYARSKGVNRYEVEKLLRQVVRHPETQPSTLLQLSPRHSSRGRSMRGLLLPAGPAAGGAQPLVAVIFDPMGVNSFRASVLLFRDRTRFISGANRALGELRM